MDLSVGPAGEPVGVGKLDIPTIGPQRGADATGRRMQCPDAAPRTSQTADVIMSPTLRFQARAISLARSSANLWAELLELPAAVLRMSNSQWPEVRKSRRANAGSDSDTDPPTPRVEAQAPSGPDAMAPAGSEDASNVAPMTRTTRSQLPPKGESRAADRRVSFQQGTSGGHRESSAGFLAAAMAQEHALPAASAPAAGLDTDADADGELGSASFRQRKNTVLGTVPDVMCPKRRESVSLTANSSSFNKGSGSCSSWIDDGSQAPSVASSRRSSAIAAPGHRRRRRS